jgi:hypothetical protein
VSEKCNTKVVPKHALLGHDRFKHCGGSNIAFLYMKYVRCLEKNMCNKICELHSCAISVSVGFHQIPIQHLHNRLALFEIDFVTLLLETKIMLVSGVWL